MDGRIIRAVGGRYAVETAEGVYDCRARGIFRSRGISPYAGDKVRISAGENAEPMIEEIYPRKNELIRPPLANLDTAILVIAAREPSPNAYVIDKLIAILEYKEIEAIPVFTKPDLAECSALSRVYEALGYRCFKVNNKTGEGAEPLKEALKGKVSAMIGNSGVGKSSLMNLIFPSLGRETGEISKKLGRGRHTTREVVLTPYEGGYIADTPGFSTVEVGRYAPIPKEELKNAF
ncbi:MAG: ribosome small subunit-dependent GTPase A, partial [Eubacterium sp.]|nr:ribosome small subunit-dependent GTPase A [Eubacterium sp.]